VVAGEPSAVMWQEEFYYKYHDLLKLFDFNFITSKVKFLNTFQVFRLPQNYKYTYWTGYLGQVINTTNFGVINWRETLVKCTYFKLYF